MATRIEWKKYQIKCNNLRLAGYRRIAGWPQNLLHELEERKKDYENKGYTARTIKSPDGFTWLFVKSPDDKEVIKWSYVDSSRFVTYPGTYKKRIMHRIEKQEEKGLRKYGKHLERNDLPMFDRVEHLAEELTDGLKYVEHLKLGLNGVRSVLMDIANDMLWYSTQVKDPDDKEALNSFHYRIMSLIQRW